MRHGSAVVHDRAAPEARAYYELLGDLYRAAWGDSIHFAVFRGAESRAEAALATERMIADEGGFGAGMSVLDVGCGSGGPALTIAEHSGARITGIDLVPHHVDLAREKAGERGLTARTEFLLGDATDLPFEDASFDHVYAIESAYHAADKARFYAECARVLRPGGSFVGTDWLAGPDTGDPARADLLDAVRARHAIPSLLGLDEVRGHLGAAGLVPEVVEDLADRGNVERNWEPLGLEAWPRLTAAVNGGPPGALRRWRAAAEALAAAAAAGAFIVGFWRARRPA